MKVRVTLNMDRIRRGLDVLASKPAIDATVLGIAESARDKWVRLAQAGLQTARQAYVLGIQPAALEGDGAASVELVGTLPNMIERGADPFDLREGLLREGRYSEAGHRYRVVPLRMTGPGTRGAVGQPMESVYEAPGPGSRSGRLGVRAGAKLIGREIAALAKGLKPGQSLPDLGLPKLQPGHSRDPFSGTKYLGAGKHRYYAAFRTVSDAVEKWQHPGLSPRGFAVEVAQHVQKIGPQAFRALAKDLLSLGKNFPDGQNGGWG